MQLRADCLVAFEAGHGHVENGFQALGLDAFNDIGANASADGLAHGIGVVVVGEHDDGPRLVTADHDHLFHHVPAGGVGVDQYHVGANRFDPLGQVDGQTGFLDHLEAGFDQSGAQATDLARGVVDQENAKHDCLPSQGLGCGAVSPKACSAKLRAYPAGSLPSQRLPSMSMALRMGESGTAIFKALAASR